MHRDTIVCDVEAKFVKHKISGASLIDDSGCLVGFVSKSDITRFDSTGDDPNYARAYEIANRKVITINPSASIEEAAQKMVDEQVHHLVVVEEESIVGMLSAFDFARLAVTTARDDHLVK
jgi:CBS domain-containing protein